MKSFFIFLLLSLFTRVVAGQEIPFPPGVYLTFDELKSKTPTFQYDFQIVKRDGGEIALNGGNDFKLVPANDSLDNKYLKNEIYAYVKNDHLLLNGKPHDIQKWYMMAETYGNFIAFYGSVTNGEATSAALLGGAIGGAIASGNRHLYVLSLRTGNVRRLSADYMTERLREYPDLAAKFAAETGRDQKDEEVLLRYVKLLNEELEIK